MHTFHPLYLVFTNLSPILCKRDIYVNGFHDTFVIFDTYFLIRLVKSVILFIMRMQVLSQNACF